LVKVGVGFGETLQVEKEALMAFCFDDFEMMVHLDRILWADFDADATSHADRDVDFEDFGASLKFAVFVACGFDANALWGAFAFAHFAGDTSEGAFFVRAWRIEDEEWEVAIVRGQASRFLRVLLCGEPVGIVITADEVSGGYAESFDDACA
jgi:hypothetical protein